MPAAQKVFLNHVVGLRGIAILLVLFFHTASKYCQCGQFGVDVFFVISGYFLFTGIERAYARGAFSLAEFYGKKVLRIFPLLISLVLVLFPVVLWFTTLTVRQSYGETALSTLLGLSNEYLEFFTKGYFDMGSGNNPLRHTWYLSVTLQMYLLLPILIILSKRWAAWLRKAFWILIFSISFLAFHHQPAFTQNAPEVPACLIDPLYTMLGGIFGTDWLFSDASPYYWTLGRVWELLAGALIPRLPEATKGWRTTLALIGLALILVPAFTFTPESLFTLPAVCGTMLAFRYGSGGPVETLLTTKPLFWVGTISFSLYIWHWPVLVFWFELVRGAHDWIAYLATISISLLISQVVWKYVETRHFSKACIGWSWLAALMLCGALAPTGGASWTWLGIPRQMSIPLYHETRVCSANPLLQDVPGTVHPMPDFYGGGIHKNSVWDNHDDALLLEIGPTSASTDFLMTGDSHANALFPAVDTFCRETGLSGVYLRTYITPLPGRHWQRGYGNLHVSPEKTEDFLKWMERHPEIKKVILGQWWEMRLKSYTEERAREGASRETALREYEAMLEQVCTRLAHAGKKVALVSQIPILLHVPTQTDTLHHINSANIKGRQTDFAELSVSREEYLAYSRPTREMFERLQAKGLCCIIHQDTSLFEDGVFHGYCGDGIMVRDVQHLTLQGAMKALEGMRGELERFLHGNTPTGPGVSTPETAQPNAEKRQHAGP